MAVSKSTKLYSQYNWNILKEKSITREYLVWMKSLSVEELKQKTTGEKYNKFTKTKGY